MHGHNVSHSMRHTKRQWQPNVQKRRVFIDGEYKKIYICTRCLRTLTKESRGK
jgi:large subunit ribosomal protein L28